MLESKRRSLVKALSWRFVATFITGGIVWILTEKATFAVTVGLLDTTIKFLAYYFHERVWNKINFGRKKPDIEYQI